MILCDAYPHSHLKFKNRTTIKAEMEGTKIYLLFKDVNFCYLIMEEEISPTYKYLMTFNHIGELFLNSIAVSHSHLKDI